MQHIVIAPPGGASSVSQAFLVPNTREAIELALDAFIARLDEIDGDPDLEPNGDELDGTGAEDDFCTFSDAMGYPGCPVSDPGGGNVDDDGEDLRGCEQ